MGIHGIYKEIGPGKRVALSRIAIEKLEETGRPLRIAIDTSIWLFQIQASKGGTNPALRTFYYRLLRLIALSIHPVFVFDGPNKPPFKRNKRTGPNVASIPEFLAKQLLKQFGFPIHLAPGEAEAECALLQRESIVDAVLSEDVDTLMFGSGITIRNWSPERSGKTPTHVNVYDAVETKNGPSGLDREGMILVALMSGGDYVPEGIPGCGPKTACEAAKAGFGTDLCNIPRNDARAIAEWRARLQHELKTNESKLFKRKHGSLKIPEDFPRLDILGYYTHPAISNQSGLDRLRRSIKWDQDLDFPGLRGFTYDAFDWVKLEGAKHFIRSLAPSLLVRQLRLRAENLERLSTNDLQAIQEDEASLIKGIHGKRQHPVTDNSTELRVSFTPIELVKIDIEQEDPDDDLDTPLLGSQTNEIELDEELPLDGEDEGSKKRGPTKFDPGRPARVWIMESIVKIGVPLKVQDWEAERQTKLKPRPVTTAQEPTSATQRTKRNAKPGKPTRNMPQAPIERFGKITKPGVKLSEALAKTQDEHHSRPVPISRPQSYPRQDVVDVLDLLSSPPVRANLEVSMPVTSSEKFASAEFENLPASVTKRRRRGPMQRSQTLPTNTSEPCNRPLTPPLLDTIETLDLLDSPIRPSPIQLHTKKAKTRDRKEASISGPPRSMSVICSPGKARQTTLDAWRASATPTKLKDVTPSIDLTPIPAPPQLRISTDRVETLDMTLSSPLCPVSSTSGLDTCVNMQQSLSRSFTERLLTSTSSNSISLSPPTTHLASNRARSIGNAANSSRSRCVPPHLNQTASVPSVIESLDLTSSPFTAPANSAAPPLETQSLTRPQSTVRHGTVSSDEIDTLDLTVSSPSTPHIGLSIPPGSPSPASSSPPENRRSPRNHKGSSSTGTSPPAAWKAREKKKRHIILRNSVAGTWDYEDIEVSVKTGGVGGETVRKEKERRRWRESEVQVLDLT